MIYSLVGGGEASKDASIRRLVNPSRSKLPWPLIKEALCYGLEVSQDGISRSSDEGTFNSNSVCAQFPSWSLRGSGMGAIYLSLLYMMLPASSVSSLAPSCWV